MTVVAPTDQSEPETDAAIEDYDHYYSGLVSFVFHFVLYLAISLLSGIAIRDKLSPAVDVVNVASTDSRGTGTDDGMEGTDSLEALTPDPASSMSPSTPAEEVATAKAAEKVSAEVASDAEIAEQVTSQVGRAKSAAQRAREQLAQGLGGAASGGGDASGGKSGKTGRAGRAARWILRFNTRSPRDHLAQLGSLKADVAFPESGGQYRFFTNLAGTPMASVRDLTGDSRIFWVDEDGSSFQGLARELGVAGAEHMIAFLPQALEARMLELEMTLAREKGASSEDDIVQTLFECVRRDGSYDVRVSDIRLAR